MIVNKLILGIVRRRRQTMKNVRFKLSAKDGPKAQFSNKKKVSKRLRFDQVMNFSALTQFFLRFPNFSSTNNYEIQNAVKSRVKAEIPLNKAACN